MIVGLVLYVSTPEERDKIFGKLFGYVGEDEHLYSLEYLIEIGAFKSWQKNLTLWETDSYEDMLELFAHSGTTDEIYLTPEQYNRFILLYRSDQLNHGSINPEDISDLIGKDIYKGGYGKIKLEWC
jgi:hypothetical protein